MGAIARMMITANVGRIVGFADRKSRSSRCNGPAMASRRAQCRQSQRARGWHVHGAYFEAAPRSCGGQHLGSEELNAGRVEDGGLHRLRWPARLISRSAEERWIPVGTRTPSVTQRSWPSLKDVVVEPGKGGMLLEQLAPEQGAGLGDPGAWKGR